MNSREVHKSRQHSIIVPLRKSYPIYFRSEKNVHS